MPPIIRVVDAEAEKRRLSQAPSRERSKRQALEAENAALLLKLADAAAQLEELKGFKSLYREQREHGARLERLLELARLESHRRGLEAEALAERLAAAEDELSQTASRSPSARGDAVAAHFLFGAQRPPGHEQEQEQEQEEQDEEGLPPLVRTPAAALSSRSSRSGGSRRSGSSRQSAQSAESDHVLHPRASARGVTPPLVAPRDLSMQESSMCFGLATAGTQSSLWNASVTQVSLALTDLPSACYAATCHAHSATYIDLPSPRSGTPRFRRLRRT